MYAKTQLRKHWKGKSKKNEAFLMPRLVHCMRKLSLSWFANAKPPCVTWTLAAMLLAMHGEVFMYCMRKDFHYIHAGVIKWKQFQRYWPFVRGIHQSPLDSPHKGQRRAALMFSLLSAWTNGWARNRDPGDLRRHRAHYDATVMFANLVLTNRSQYIDGLE